MAKGDLSKKKLTQSILDLYSNNSFVQDKNIYINFRENGENLQLKIGITMPKQPIEFAISTAPQTTSTGDFDWRDKPASANTPISTQSTAEITQEEINTVAEMLKKLNL